MNGGVREMFEPGTTRAIFAVSMVGMMMAGSVAATDFTVVDTGQSGCYDSAGYEIECPSPGGECFGQDAQHTGNRPAYLDNGDGSITDRSTGLMWSREDSGFGMAWEDALAWVETMNAEAYLGYSDWRLPNAKELHSIVDSTRSPDTTGSAAIDPVFSSTSIVNEGFQLDFPFFWCSTTHLEGLCVRQGVKAAYIAFGRALGWMEMPPGSGNRRLLDVHGAGSQRSDPKAGDPGDYPYGHGPQGDVVRILNFVRLVRDDPCAGSAESGTECEDGESLQPTVRRASGRRRSP